MSGIDEVTQATQRDNSSAHDSEAYNTTTSCSRCVCFACLPPPPLYSQEEYELTEFHDSERVVLAKVAVLARIMTTHRNSVMYVPA